MSNPSTIWAQLSLPYPPAGSIPFVDTDNQTIVIDSQNFFYDPVTHTLHVTGGVAGGVSAGYQDKSATPGDVTINQLSGRVAIATGTLKTRVTNNLVLATSVVNVQIEGRDIALTFYDVEVNVGFFDIIGNQNVAGGNLKFSFVVTPTIIVP